jgi:hypothetical protein
MFGVWADLVWSGLGDILRNMSHFDFGEGRLGFVSPFVTLLPFSS